MHNEFNAIIEKDGDWFISYCPEIPGANGQGRTKEECLKREGTSHSLWCNPQTGHVEAVPRHTEIPNLLARKILRNLSIPEI